MRAAPLILAATLVAVSSQTVLAQTFPGAPGATVLSGKCQKLVVSKLDASKGCKSELASVTAPDGTVTFIFTSQGKMLGFVGDGKSTKPASNGNARFPLDQVVSGVGTNITGQVKVAGTCTFGNPYGGKPTIIECTAKSKDSTFTGSFRTDGKAPVKKK